MPTPFYEDKEIPTPNIDIRCLRKSSKKKKKGYGNLDQPLNRNNKKNRKYSRNQSRHK